MNLYLRHSFTQSESSDSMNEKPSKHLQSFSGFSQSLLQSDGIFLSGNKQLLEHFEHPGSVFLA